jgi:DNA-binding NarL/FixJ family response regulator
VEPTASGRVLVVEDDPLVARLLVRAVSRLAQPVCGTTVREGIALLDGGPACRAAILDLGLPDGSAVEIIEHAQRAGFSLPALIVSGESDPAVARAMRAMGAGFCLKPVDGAAIEQFVRDAQQTDTESDEPQPPSAASRLLTGMADAAVADLRAQYAIGQFVHCLRYPGPDETSGLQHLVALGLRLDLHPSALRRRARVSETVRADEFEALLALRSPRGLPLKWSHFELLSAVRSRSRREATAIRILAEDLSVRECVALVRAAARERARAVS